MYTYIYNIYIYIYILYIYTNLFFRSAVMKMYHFTTLCWVNKDENICTNKFFQPVGQCIFHNYWKQIYCLKLVS